jgi:ubiquinone biosynthesis protein
MQVQPSLVLLQKTLLKIEGLGRQLYPELDLWDTAKPFLENWLRERYSPKSLLKHLQRHAPGWLEQLPHVPDRLFERLATVEPAINKQQLQQQQEILNSLKKQQRYLLISCFVFLGCSAAMLYQLL